MKHIILTICILLGLCTYALPMAEAQSDSPTATRSTKKKKLTAKEKREAAKAKKAAAKAEKEAAKAKKVAAKKSAAAKRAFDSAEPTSKVGQFLKAQTYATDARPNLEAKYYVVYRSSSTCGHCHKLMPQILEAHALMLASAKVAPFFSR